MLWWVFMIYLEYSLASIPKSIARLDSSLAELFISHATSVYRGLDYGVFRTLGKIILWLA